MALLSRFLHKALGSTALVAVSIALANPAHAAGVCVDLFGREIYPAPPSLTIVARDHEVLRAEAKPVLPSEIGTPRLADTVGRMIEIMDQSSGVGIAAPQVGLSKRIIVAQIQVPEATRFEQREDLVVMLNPRIVPVGEKKSHGLEGCLSLGALCAIVPRDKAVRVEFEDLDGVGRSLVVSGHSARILQHEVDHLQGLFFIDRAVSVPELLKVTRQKSLEEKVLINDVKMLRGKSEAIEYLRWRMIFGRIARQLGDPYSLVWDLRAEVAKSGGTLNGELRSLAKILLVTPAQERAAALDTWTRSETHALFLYDLLAQRGLGEYSETLSYLIDRNLYFSDANPMRGPPAVLTYSFEKEGRNPEIASLYRPPKISDRDWFAKPPEERVKELGALKIPLKTFRPATSVAPTELKPSFLSGYSVELTDRQRPPPHSWEISHKRYEISLHRTMQEIRQVAHLFGETHSFHVHTVFELPRVYAKFREFRDWFKSFNDYLYLRGMEEGLHGNDLTDVVNLREDGGSIGARNTLTLEGVGSISKFGAKFFSAGLRGGGFYGPASVSANVKVGLELRDTTRDLVQLDFVMTRLSKSIVDTAWESLPRESKPTVPRLHTVKQRSLEALVKSGIPVDIAKRFIQAESTAAVPLIEFESGTSFDYATSQLREASPAEIARIRSAREKYLKSLMALQVELGDFAAKNEKVDKGDIGLAIRMSLTDWAREAKASSRFSF